MEARLADDGELLVRGPLVMRGYRGQPHETAAAIDPDGFFHTGDLATIDEDGYCRIIGRKKEIIINASGKNMSPALIERAILSETDLCAVVVCIGDGRPYNTGLIVLDSEACARFTAQHLPDTTDPEKVFADLADAVSAAVERGNSKLSRVEQIRRHTILPGAWLPGGDEMTPTMKVRRHVVAAKYADVIEAMYAEG
jgi:long-subunit acyl-CoA synthetase (AMP-forming)